MGLTLPPSVRGLVAFLEDLPMVADGPINGGRMGDTSFHLTVLDEYDVLELGGSLCAPLRFGILLADLDVEPLQVLAFGLDYERRSNGVPALHHVRSQELFRFVYEELFTAAFLDYGRRFEGSCDWGACQMWLASEFPYFTPHPAGGIFEGVNRSALLHRGAGGVGLWSQLGLDGLVLPPHLRTADEPEQEPYLQRLASRLAIIATFGLDDIPF